MWLHKVVVIFTTKTRLQPLLATDLKLINWMAHLACIIEANGGYIGVTTLNVEWCC